MNISLSSHRSGKPPAPAAAPAPAAEPVAPIFDSLQSQNEQLYRDILTEQQQLQQLSLVSAPELVTFSLFFLAFVAFCF